MGRASRKKAERKTQPMREEPKTVKTGPKPKGKLRRLGKRVGNGLVIAALTAGLGVGAHHIAKKELGPVYPKRIPVIGSVFEDGHQIDFYLAPHTSSRDLKPLEKILRMARGKREPYNVMLVEGGTTPKGQRHVNDNKINKEARALRSDVYMLVNHPDRRVKKAARAEVAKVEKYIAELDKQKDRLRGVYPGHIAQRTNLAAKYDLHVAGIEEHSRKDLEKNGELWQAALDARGMTLEEAEDNFVAFFSEFLSRRNDAAVKTLPVVKDEIISSGVLGGHKMKAIAVIGPGHEDIVRRVDDILMSRVGIAYKEPPNEVRDRMLIRAAELAAKGMPAIKAYQQKVKNRTHTKTPPTSKRTQHRPTRKQTR